MANKLRKGMEDVVKLNKPIRKNGKRVASVFNKVANEIAQGKKIKDIDLNQIQREEGYSEESIRCNKVFRTATWEQMKGRDLDNFVKDGFIELADKTNDDKRTRLASLKEIATLLDLYPGKRMQIEMLNEKNEAFFE